MNKSEFLRAVAEDSCMSLKDVSKVYASIQSVITGSLIKGERITITGFGTFEAKPRKARICRNPQTGVRINIPAKVVPSFKPGKVLKEALK